jgi:transcriptional regulator with XRE-family HTH domain
MKAPSNSLARIKRVIETGWAGNQSRFAVALGVSPGLISQILGGKRPPTKNLLNRVAELPGVNRHYLLHGEGPPMFATAASTADCFLPVYRQPEPEATSWRQQDLAGLHLPVAHYFYREGGCWLLIDRPTEEMATKSIVAGELFLMHPATPGARNPEDFASRWCLIRNKATGETPESFELAMVLPDGESLQVYRIPKHQSLHRRLLLDKSQEPEAKNSSPKAKKIHQPIDPDSALSSDDIVAVCVQIVRPQ